MSRPVLGGPEYGPAEICASLFTHGRLPRLGDAIPPWKYRGWLLSYVQLADVDARLPGRWTHHLRTLETGKLLDEPIPRIEFSNTPDPKGVKMLDRCLGLAALTGSVWNAFTTLVDWLGWGLAVSAELPELDDAVQESLYRTFNAEPLLLSPHDYLGALLADRRSGAWNPNAFYPTPHPVAEMMVQMTMGRGGDGDLMSMRTKRVLEPAVGTGRILLHASNLSYCLYGMDIDPLVVAITRINAALYAPWMAFPLPASIVGVELPAPPPAPLPVPNEYQPPAGKEIFRSDDRGQGLLPFD